MRRIPQVLQLRFGAGASARVIAGEIGLERSTVQDYLARVSAAGLMWPLAPDLTDKALERLLFPPRNGGKSAPADIRNRTGPRWRAR